MAALALQRAGRRESSVSRSVASARKASIKPTSKLTIEPKTRAAISGKKVAVIKEDSCTSESKQMSPRVHKVARECSGRRSISTEAAKQVPSIGGPAIAGLVRAVRPTVLLKTLPGGGRLSDKLESDPDVKKLEVKEPDAREPEVTSSTSKTIEAKGNDEDKIGADAGQASNPRLVRKHRHHRRLHRRRSRSASTTNDGVVDETLIPSTGETSVYTRRRSSSRRRHSELEGKSGGRIPLIRSL